MSFSNERVRDCSAMSYMYDIIISGMSIYKVNTNYSNRLKCRDIALLTLARSGWTGTLQYNLTTKKKYNMDVNTRS